MPDLHSRCMAAAAELGGLLAARPLDILLRMRVNDGSITADDVQIFLQAVLTIHLERQAVAFAPARPPLPVSPLAQQPQ